MRFRQVCAGLLVAVVSFSGLAALAAEDEIPAELKTQLEDVLKKKVSDLVAEKGSDGLQFKTGNYSRIFRKVDDATYLATFQQITAGKEQQKVERFEVTLQKGGDGKWSIGKMDLKDTYDGMYRGIIGDEEFLTFDSFTFEREGLKVSTGPGSLYKDFWRGKPVRIRARASAMTYSYSPPVDAKQQQVHGMLTEIRPEDFVFTPDHFNVECTPAECEQFLSTSFRGLKPATVATVDAGLRSDYEEVRKKAEDARRQSPMGGFMRGPYPDRKYWTLTLGRKAGRDNWVALGYDNYDPWEMGFYASGYFGGPIFAYYSEDTRASGKSEYELEKRDDSDSRDYELFSLKGTVELALEDPYTYKGDLTYGLNTKRPLKEIPFRVTRLQRTQEEAKEAKDPLLFIDSVRDGDGRELTWVKTGGASGVVILADEVPEGFPVTLRMVFTNKDSIYKLNPSYSYVDRGGWLPFVRFGDMIDEFEMTVKVPARYKALGIGKRLSETEVDGVNVTTWAASKPVNFPTVIFGDYIEDRSGFEAKKLDGSVIPVNIHVDKVSTQALDSYESATSGARDIRGKQLRNLADQAANSLNLYAAIYGVDYPFDKLDLVNDPLGFLYGQAPSSIIYLGAFVFRGEGEVAGGAASTSTAKFLKDVVAHETAHQWWGATVANANMRNYWFVESLAEYSSALFVENAYGPKKYQEKIEEWRQNVLRANLMASVQNASATWSGGGFGSYQAAVYNQGPYAFHILRQTFGDEKFFAFLKNLAKELKQKEIVTRDIQSVMEQSYGFKMDWFFDQWIRGVGLPQYNLTWGSRRTEDGKYLIEGSVKQRVVVGEKKQVLKDTYYRGLVYLTFVMPDGKKVKSAKPMLVEGPETPIRIKLAEQPAEVLLNADGEVLAHDVLVNKPW